MNPIFQCDYPDSSILRDGDDFYLVNSSFEYYPGLSIWHSTGLINWKPVTNALNKYVGSVWAPYLIKYDGNCYMIFHGYENGYYNMGRQTILVPIEWIEDSWFKISDDISDD